MASATDVTREHYERPGVREVILGYCRDGDAFRALNGGERWYAQGSKPGEVRLTSPNDYDLLTDRFRTLYTTIDILDSAVFDVSEPWNSERGEPENTIGTLADCRAFTLSVDIDSIKGLNGEDITKSPEIKQAVEDAGQFYVDYLRKRGITKSIHCLYSGGGIYVHVHHALFKANPDWTPSDREHGFRSLALAFNLLIAEVEREFFKAHAEHKGRVKFDKLNNQKRKFKVIFSIHKRLPFAVIPLNPDHIEIDFNKAKLPLSQQVLDEGRRWYQRYDPTEIEALKALLEPFADQAEEELKERKGRTGDYEIYRAVEPAEPEEFPPCIKNIIEKVEPSKGPHRALAILAAYLYQAGWNEDKAFELWKPIADRVSVEPRIFDQWFGRMICPNCKTMQKESAGYPSVGLGGLGYCAPDESCDVWPGNYGIKSGFKRLFQKPKEPSAAVIEENGTIITEEELNAYSLPEGPKFECKLPNNHFIPRFMAYGSEVSDAYPDYWFACGLFTLAVVADKKLKVILRQGTVYPNLYISINGKSSLARKSTATDKAEEKLCQVLPQLRSALVPTEFSPEAFTEHLSEFNHAPWIRDEAAGVLSLMKKDYMRGFKDSLMLLYDCKPFYRKLRTSQRKNVKTEFRVDDPYLNVLFATTDTSLGANTEQNDTLSGFLARFLFFFPQGMKLKWLPLEEGTALNSIFEEAVRSQLSGIADKIKELKECTAMHFSPEAAKYYTEWQRVREVEWTASNDGYCMQIYSRLAPAVTKLGMLFELGSPDFDVSRPIRLEFIQEACRLVDSYLLPTARAVYDIVGANIEKNVIVRIIAYLKNHNGKATRKEIMRDIKIKKADFEDYLNTMIEIGMVEIKIVERGGKGRDSVYVILSRVGNVANVANVAIVAKVEEIPGNNPKIEDSTLATMATLATKATQATEATTEIEPKENQQPAIHSEDEGPKTGKVDRPTPVKCSSCGADITGKTQVIKNSKTCCKDCGYPEESKPDRDCGSCPIALKGDRTAIKCDPCVYFGSKPKVDLIMVRFLKPVDTKVVGIGDSRIYGPFAVDDVASLPPANARIFVEKGLATEVQTGDGNKGAQQATPSHVVVIKTSNYYSDWNNPNAISIAKYDGKRYTGKYKGPHYKDLAPNDDIWDKYKHDPDYNSERYTADFLKQLAALDPLKVYQDLCALRPGCTEIVLLCFEPPGEFCHRRLVAEWLGEALGMKIDEIAKPSPKKAKDGADAGAMV